MDSPRPRAIEHNSPQINVLDMRTATTRAIADVNQATETVPTRELAQEGVQNVRVLSESKFQDLLFEIVDERVQAAFGNGVKGADESEFDVCAAVAREDDRTHIRKELSDAYRKTWKDYRDRNGERLATLENRLRRAQDRFSNLEELVARLFDGVASDELGDET